MKPLNISEDPKNAASDMLKSFLKRGKDYSSNGLCDPVIAGVSWKVTYVKKYCIYVIKSHLDGKFI